MMRHDYRISYSNRHFKIVGSHRSSPTGGGRSVGIVRSRTKAMEFSLVLGSHRWKSYGEYICNAFHLILKYSLDGPMIFLNEQNV
jgi:hypothetical protein